MPLIGNIAIEWTNGVPATWDVSDDAFWEILVTGNPSAFKNPGGFNDYVIVEGKIADPELKAGAKLSPLLTMRATKGNIAKTLYITEADAATRASALNLPGRFLISIINTEVIWWQVTRNAVDKFVNG